MRCSRSNNMRGYSGLPSTGRTCREATIRCPTHVDILSIGGYSIVLGSPNGALSLEGHHQWYETVQGPLRVMLEVSSRSAV
ncbi:hypothetical protein CLAIMM_01770 [Cladophialophora immunda]|nr:hypothetical protein CLAIMM_01770 [Cladophialophora immunda]